MLSHSNLFFSSFGGGAASFTSRAFFASEICFSSWNFFSIYLLSSSWICAFMVSAWASLSL